MVSIKELLLKARAPNDVNDYSYGLYITNCKGEYKRLFPYEVWCVVPEELHETVLCALKEFKRFEIKWENR